MAEKKRKGENHENVTGLTLTVPTGAASVPASGPPTKKSRKTTASEPLPETTSKVNELATTPLTTNESVTKSKSGRKRAADFLGDDEETTVAASTKPEPEKSGKKDKKSAGRAASRQKANGVSLTADGVNGIVENSETAEVEIKTAKEPASTSLEAEGLRTVDNELREENASDDDDQGAALLAGFDSDSEDAAEDQGDTSKTQPIPQFKKTSKKLKQAREKGSDGPGTVYVGRIPHGFYETQMRDYFTQFGNITRLRLSRNKRTGASKHFAFIEFESDEVAKIVAETMDNYLMFGHILKCKYAPTENLHPDTWKGANKKYRKIPHEKLERQQLEAPKSQEYWTKKNEKERQKRTKQAEKMKSIGYVYDMPDLKDPAELVERKKQEEHGIPPAALTNEEQPDAIEPPPAPPADEIALKNERDLKKEKKPKKPKASTTSDLLTQGNLDARNAGPAAESAKLTQNKTDKKNKVETADNTASKSTTKKTRSKKGGSTIESSHGDYDNLSSIAVGTEAAPLAVTDAVPAEELGSISTYAGVADAVLAGRKSDRKIDRKNARPTKRTKSTEQKAEEEVADIAPGAVEGVKKEKNQPRGILKRTKRA